MHIDSKRCIHSWTALSFFIAPGDVSLQNYNFNALHAFVTCRGATSIYFCSFQMLEVQIPSRPKPFSTISKENNVSEKKKGKTSHVLGCGTVLASFRCWRLHTKISFPSRCSFWHAIQRPVRYLRPVVAEIWMNTWSITFLQSTSSVFPRRPFQNVGKHKIGEDKSRRGQSGCWELG